MSHAVVSVGGGEEVIVSNEVIFLQTVPPQISVVSSISTREKTAVVGTYACFLPNEEAHKSLHHICASKTKDVFKNIYHLSQIYYI